MEMKAYGTLLITWTLMAMTWSAGARHIGLAVKPDVGGYTQMPNDTLMKARTDTAQTDTLQVSGLKIVNRADRILDWRDKRERHHADTTCMMRSSDRIRLIFRLNASGTSIVSEGWDDNGQFKSKIGTDDRYTISAGASYRGLTAALSLNPARLAGKNKDYEFNLNAYGNRIGADVIFQSANTFSGTHENSTGTMEIPVGLVRQNMLYVNTYYVLNNRRFSYPAAFSQSWIQKRSSGSLIAGMSFIGGNLRVVHSEELDNQATRISITDLGIGIGYGYNWVIRKKWLLHISALPEIVAYSNCRTMADGEKAKTPYRFPNLINVGRIALVRNFDKFHIGINAVETTSILGDRDQMRLLINKWCGRLVLGIRL